MKNKEYMSIEKMIEYIDQIQSFTKEYIFEEFIMDDRSVYATVFSISQIGELVKNISQETRNKYINIRWSVVKSLRNKIVHDYEGIDLTMIWYILKNDLPQLKIDLKDILKKEKVE